MQTYGEGYERVIAFKSYQHKAAENNYPVRETKLLSMTCALVNFKVHLLGSKSFFV